jgi:hypothetical protein
MIKAGDKNSWDGKTIHGTKLHKGEETHDILLVLKHTSPRCNREIWQKESFGVVKLVMKNKPIAQHNNTSFNLQFGFFFSLIHLYLKKIYLKKFLCTLETDIWRHICYEFHFEKKKVVQKEGKEI